MEPLVQALFVLASLVLIFVWYGTPPEGGSW